MGHVPVALVPPTKAYLLLRSVLFSWSPPAALSLPATATFPGVLPLPAPIVSAVMPLVLSTRGWGFVVPRNCPVVRLLPTKLQNEVVGLEAPAREAKVGPQTSVRTSPTMIPTRPG